LDTADITPISDHQQEQMQKKFRRWCAAMLQRRNDAEFAMR
jgi:hypothetical protein